MGGLQRESAVGDVAGEGAVGVRVGGGAVCGVSSAASCGMGIDDAGVVDCEGDVPRGLPVGRVLRVVPLLAESPVVQLGMVLPVALILRVLIPVVVGLVCATGDVTVQVVLRPGAPS